MSILTKGTNLYILDPRDDSITKLECPKSITGLGLSTPQINTTCLESTAEEFQPGMPSPGAATVGLDFDTAKASHMLIDDLNEAQVVAKWAIGWSDGTAAPTVDTDGDFVLPATRSWLTFEGYVADLPLDFAINSVAQSNFTIQMSGRRVIVPKT